MKTRILSAITLMTLVCAVALASSGTALRVQTTITQNAAGKKTVLMTPTITVKDGQSATIRIDDLEYAVTATLKQQDVVDIRAVLSDHAGGANSKLAAPRIKTRLGRSATIQIGDLEFATEVTRK